MSPKSDEFFYWKKGEEFKLSKHFNSFEFECKCKHPKCVYQKIACDLIEKLEQVRVLLGDPITITSGYRCMFYQLDLAKRGYETSKKTSQHELGRAADIMASHFSMLQNLVEKEFKSIGYSNRFLHVDLRSDKVRMWKYKV